MAFFGKEPPLLLKSKKDSKAKDNHDKCLKAVDYQGCINFKSGINNNPNIQARDDIDCIDFVCIPEQAIIYGTDNLGLKIIPGYFFNDIPAERAAYFWSKPMKLNVNGNFGRYIHIQRIIRYYSDDYSGSLTTIPGIGTGATSTINYDPERAPGIRQKLQNYIFDCEEKTAANFSGNRLIRTKTNTGRKKKWFRFEEASDFFVLNKGIEGCQNQRTMYYLLRFLLLINLKKKN